MIKFDGIIACGGNSTRFAQSAEVNPPYPKHLEDFGGKSILTRSFEGLKRDFPNIKRVTFALNDKLKYIYKDHLKGIQKDNPGIKISYTSTIDIDSKKLLSHIKTDMSQGVHDLSGYRLQVEDPVVVIALGDCVVKNRDNKQIDLDEHYSELLSGKSLAVFENAQSGLIYWAARLSKLGEGAPDYIINGQEHGLSRINCNTREELANAKQKEGHRLTMAEAELLNHRYGKERM